MRRKGVSLLLSALLVWALALPSAAAVNPFPDVRSDHWAYEAIVTLAAAGLIEGYPDGTFGGDRNFTRYEMAMVFARMLARLEALIDQKIEDGIAARTDELAAQIAATRDELSRKIDANYDELAARIAALENDVGVLEGQVNNIFSLLPEREGGLSESAEAALRELVADEIRAQLEGLGAEDLQDLAERILRLEGSTPSRDEVEAIAERVVAEALAGEGPAELGVRAAEGDAEALDQLIDERVEGLGARVAALMDEFESELNQLGVDVARLEDRLRRVEATVERNDVRLTNAEAAIEELRDAVGNVRLSGKNETVFEHTAVTKDDDGVIPHVDPRDRDSDELEAGNTFTNTLNLTLTAMPAENVEVKASLDVVSDVFGVAEEDDEDLLKASANVDVTTSGVLRSLHVGDLEDGATAERFDKYTLVAPDEDEDSRKWRGASANLVFGQDDSTGVYGFVSRIDDAKHVFGAAMSYTLSEEFDLTLRGVRLTTSPSATASPPAEVENESDVSLESKGSLASVDYEATFAMNGDETPANAVEAWVEAPVAFATARLDYGAIDADWDAEYGRDFAEDDPDWLMRHLHPNADKDPLVEGQSEYKLTLSAPVFGAQAAVAFGQRDETQTKDPVAGVVRDRDTFTQVSVSDLNFAGIDAAVLFDQRENEDSETDRTVRADFGASLLGFELAATVHNRENEQADAAEREQRSVWVKAGREIDLFLPVTFDTRFGVNQVLDQTATKVGVSTEYTLGAVTLNGGYTVEQNAIGDLDDDVDKVWWRNAEWTTAEWGGRRRDTLTAGASYTLKGFFGTDIDTRYEYKLVSRDGEPYGTAQNTFSASFEKELRGGEATLAGEGKVVTGGVPGHDGNDTDVTAKLTLTYPVFEGGEVTLGGLYASSAGDARPDEEYDVFQLKAGLTVSF